MPQSARTKTLPPLSTGRVESFSDGVLSVAITLLALNLKLPPGLTSESELWRSAMALVPSFAVWTISFAFILTIWINHHLFFRDLRHVDRTMLWLNGVLLLFVTIIPFPTGLIGLYPGFRMPLTLLSGAMLAASLSFAAMRFHASYSGALMNERLGTRQVSVKMAWSLFGCALYALATVLSFYSAAGAGAAQVAALAFYIFGPPALWKD